MIVRLLTENDVELWKTLRKEAVSLHPTAYHESEREVQSRSDEDFRNNIRNGSIFVCFDGQGEALGMAGYFTYLRDNLAHKATVFTVYVRKNARGKGVMDALFEAIESHARERGIRQLHLGVAVNSPHAIGCYERNGFRLYGTEPRAMQLNGEFLDEHLMVKILS